MLDWLLARKPPRKPKAPPPAPEDPLTDDDEDDDLEEETPDQRRKSILVYFRRTKTETESRVTFLTGELASGEIDSREWAAEFRSLLADAHSHASAIGRNLAGDLGPFGKADVAAGQAAWDEQDDEYFGGFLSDLEAKDPRYVKADGTLNVKAFDARARSYVAAIRGTVHRAFKAAMGKDRLWWRLGPTEHCMPSPGYEFDCTTLSEQSPKPADEWETEPAGGKTPCGNNCGCYWEADGFSTEGI